MAVHSGVLFSESQTSIGPGSNVKSVYAEKGLAWPVDPLHPDVIAFDATQYDGSHTDNTPISFNGDVQAGFLTANTFDEFYSRVISTPKLLTLGNIANDKNEEIKVFNGYFHPRTLISITVVGDTGVTVSGVTLPKTFNIGEEVALDVLVLAAGAPEIAASLNFVFLDTANNYSLLVSGFRIVAMPFQATVPMKEKLSWRTNVLPTINNKEQRVRTRGAPRQLLDVAYPVLSRQSAIASNLIHGWQSRIWAIPDWTKTQIISSVTAGQLVVPCVTEIHNILPDTLVMFWNSVIDNEVLEVESVTATEMTLKSSLFGSYTNPQLIPARLSRNIGGLNRKVSGGDSEFSSKFESLNNVRYDPSAPDQYQGEDVYFDEDFLFRGAGNQEKVLDIVNVFDSGASIPTFESQTPYARGVGVMYVVKDGLQDNYDFVQFLHRRAGKLRPFWTPTFEQDFIIVDGISGQITNSINVTSNNYDGLSFGNRDHIAVDTTTGWITAEITGVIPIDDTSYTISLDSSIGVDVLDIKRICHLDLVRFDTDDVEINWIGNAVSSCSIPIRQLEYTI